MGENRIWTILGLSTLLFAITEFTTPALSFHLGGEDTNIDTSANYRRDLDSDIGSTLRLLGILLAERDVLFQPDQTLPSAPDLSLKNGPRPDPVPDLLSSAPEEHQQLSRRDFMTSLLRRLQQRSSLQSLDDREGQTDDADGDDEARQEVGLESSFNLASEINPTSNANIDDVIPAARKTKRGRHGSFGAMPPTNELCRHYFHVSCY